MGDKPNSSSNLINIDGIDVVFPYKPYAVQEEFMKKVIMCLRKGENGLLESPTGTGKTLSLLCSTLAWLETRKAALQAEALLLKGNAANVDSQVSQVFTQLSSSSGTSTWGNGIQGNTMKIIYSSRTHSQLSQVVQEMKNCTYKYVPSVVLGSRDQLCIHPEVSRLESNSAKLHQCRLKVNAKVCPFHLNLDQKLQSESAYLSTPVLDIEDLVSLGKKHTCCPYYAARSLKSRAGVVFTPYNYLVDPKTRKAHGIDLQGNVLIFDEAHNIENVCEESMSFQIKSSDLAICINEIKTAVEAVTKMESEGGNFDFGGENTPEFNVTELSLLKAMLHELEQRIDSEAVQAGDKGITKPGSYIFQILSQVQLTRQRKDIVLDILDKVIQFLSGQTTGPWGTKGAGLQKFSDMLKVIFASNRATMKHLKEDLIIKDFDHKYKVHIQLEVSKNQASVKDLWVVPSSKSNKKHSWVLNCWCFSPGLSMEDLMSQRAHCMILTSGTLSPLESFASELEVSFPVRLENPHIITDEQVTVAVIPKGPDNYELNASFQHRSKPEYLTSLGRTVQQFARMIPDGLLVFFPSYAVMRMCIDHWQESSLWNNICMVKESFVEPKGKDAFQDCIDKYYTAIRTENSKGAILFAVCRGKVSEGLDFADANARAVIITGLPFPPAFDPRVTLKKSYLDSCTHKESLKGHEWYRLQALRAVNQAVGRVIRHRNDYGAVLLCDSRFGDRSNQNQLSFWVRNRVKTCQTFGMALKNLRDFFRVLDQKAKSQPSLKPTKSYFKERQNDDKRSPSLAEKMAETHSFTDVFGDYAVGSSSESRNPLESPLDHNRESVFDALDKTDPLISPEYQIKDYSTEATSERKVSSTPPSKRRKIKLQNRCFYSEEDPKKKVEDFASNLKKLLSKEEFGLFKRSFIEFRNNKNLHNFASAIKEIFPTFRDKEAVFHAICAVMKKEQKAEFQKMFPPLD